MKKFANYFLEDELYRSRQAVIWRGRVLGSEKKVIVKLPTDEYPNQADFSRIKREFELLKKLTIEGVVRPIEFVTYGHSCAMIMEEHNEQILSSFLQNKPLPLESFLVIAIQLTEILGLLNKEDIIHKDIKPDNILINPQGIVKLIDFSIASEIQREYQEFDHPDLLEGTLAYISPEQTGRMNRAVDYRTDFYSLGVTFYQMLTGRLPFSGQTAMEIVHAHIAEMPVPPHQILATIPTVVSEIVMKLMAKNSEQRYQSTHSLLEDLKRCLHELQEKGGISTFTIAEHDIPSKFSISQKLYGREKELEIVVNAFKSVTTGESAILLVNGAAGVGKTAIFDEVQQSIVERNGFFIRGKFDQLMRDTAYSAISGALQELAQQLLHLPEKSLLSWKNKLVEALGKNAKILIDLAADFEKVLGVQPELEELTPQQDLNRFHYTMHEFIHTIATAEHPLIIFLDDLQWADNASLNLVEEIMGSELTRYVLILGAYRGHEIGVAHPLQQMIEVLAAKKPVQQLELAALTLENVVDLLANTLHYGSTQVEALAQNVFEKSKGNPFYINVLLTEFFRERLIYFDHQNGVWAWDLTKIQAQKVSDNVVEFLLATLRELPQETQHILQLGACIGNLFDLKSLAIISDKLPANVAEMLDPAITKGLIIPLSNDYRLAKAVAEMSSTDIFRVYYQFAHDRVQQAAYELLDEQQRKKIHLSIGRMLWEKSDAEQRKQSVVDIVHHFNMGSALITGDVERQQVAEMNLQAALRAKRSSAYQTSLEYCQAAKSLLATNCWDNQYQLAFDIYLQSAESAYLLARYTAAEQDCEILLQHAQSNFEKAQVLYMQSLQYISNNNYQAAFPLAIKGLHYLGIKVKPYPNLLSVIKNFFSMLRMLKKVDVLKLADKPFTTDPEATLLAELFSNAFTAAYFINNTNFMGVLIYIVMRLMIEKPLTKKSAMFCAALDIIYAQNLNKFDTAKEWWQLTKLLIEKYYDAEAFVSSNVIYVTFLLFLYEHESAAYPILKKTLAIAQESGNKFYVPNIYALLFVFKPGITATEVCNLAIEHYPAIKDLGIPDMLNMYLLRYAYYFNITGKTSAAESLSYQYFDEQAFLAGISEKTSLVVPFIFYLTKTRVAILYDDDVNAKKFLDLATKYKASEKTLINLRAFYFYTFTVNARIWHKLSWYGKIRAKWEMHQAYRWIKRVVDYCPINFHHLLLYMDAENSALKGEILNAAHYYEQAIAAAKTNNYPEEETFIREQAAKFYLKNHLNESAAFEMRTVVLSYQQRGATRKVTQLLEKYEDLLKEIVHHDTATGTVTATISDTMTTMTQATGEQSLDLATIMKASQTISGEIELPHLLKKTLRILIENAGAQHGALLLKTNNQWCIQAQGDLSQITVLENIPLTEVETRNIPVCRNIVEYVIRQGTLLVLPNASQFGEFQQIPYIVANKCLSILCLPLINQGKLRGILYLENNITTDAFTPKMQELLQSISSQAAIAIENATLYRNVMELSLSYERFVPKEFLHLLEKKSILEVDLGDQVQKEMTVMFQDIRNFTALSEKLTPQESFNFFNKFLSYMEPIIHEHHGFIDKYMGDAIMALFAKADDAVMCGVAMLERLKIFNEEQGIPINIGIGLNTGPLMLGIVGGKNRLESTVISDAVNISARVEDLNKVYLTEFLLTQMTMDALVDPKHFHTRRLAFTQIRGKHKSVTLYEVFSHNEPALQTEKIVARERFEQAIQLFEKGSYADAKNIFEQLLIVSPNDHVCKAYLKLCAENL